MPKKILNIFISQPMHGRSEEEIVKERKEIMQLLGECNPYKKTWDLHIIDNLHHEARTWDYLPPERAARLYNLGQSISQMADADFVVIAPEYFKANGCVVEYDAAALSDIPLYVLYRDQPDGYAIRKIKNAMQKKNKWRYKK